MFSRDGEQMDSCDIGIVAKSPGSNHELKADEVVQEEEDMEAEENVENTTPGVRNSASFVVTGWRDVNQFYLSHH